MRAAALIAVSMGCGGGMSPPDTPLIEPDASQSGTVVVRVTAAGVPLEGRPVFFQNDLTEFNSRQVSTNAAGDASEVVEPNAFISIDGPDGVTDSLLTFTNVQPGEVIEVDFGRGSATTQMTLVGPTRANATGYQVYTSCGQVGIPAGSGQSQGGPISLTNCPSTISVLWDALDPSGTTLASIFATNVSVVDGGTIDLSAGTYETPIPRTYSYTNTSNDILVRSVVLLDRLGSESSPIRLTATAGTATATLVATRPSGSLDLTISSLAGFEQRNVYEWGTSGDYALDIEATTLAGVSNLAFDLEQHALTWTPTSGVTPDAIVTTISGNVSNRNIGWTLIGPMTEGVIAYPRLPGREILGVGLIGFTEYQGPGGLATIRSFSTGRSFAAFTKTSSTGRLLEFVTGAEPPH